MKRATLKVVLVVLFLSMAVSCGKQRPSLNLTKAGSGNGASDYTEMLYNDTVSGPDGTHRYIISGSTDKPLVYLKDVDTDKRIYFGITLVLRKANGKSLKANKYYFLYKEYVTCKDGPKAQGGTLQYLITHGTPTDSWSVAKGVVNLNNLGSFARDPAPASTIDPKTKQATKPARPKSGKISINAGIGEPEIQESKWPLIMGESTSDYTQIMQSNEKLWTKDDAIKAIGSNCKNAKTIVEE